MSDVLWFSGITWDTSMRDIGWTWVALVAAVVMATRASWRLWKEVRHG